MVLEEAWHREAAEKDLATLERKVRHGEEDPRKLFQLADRYGHSDPNYWDIYRMFLHQHPPHAELEAAWGTVFPRVADLVEYLTGDRDFFDNRVYYEKAEQELQRDAGQESKVSLITDLTPWDFYDAPVTLERLNKLEEIREQDMGYYIKGLDRSYQQLVAQREEAQSWRAQHPDTMPKLLAYADKLQELSDRVHPLRFDNEELLLDSEEAEEDSPLTFAEMFGEEQLTPYQEKVEDVYHRIWEHHRAVDNALRHLRLYGTLVRQWSAQDQDNEAEAPSPFRGSYVALYRQMPDRLRQLEKDVEALEEGESSL